MAKRTDEVIIRYAYVTENVVSRILLRKLKLQLQHMRENQNEFMINSIYFI